MHDLFFLKTALAENTSILKSSYPRMGVTIYKYPAQRAYVVSKTQSGKRAWWFISSAGIQAYSSAEAAFEDLFKLVKVSSTMKFIRKSSHAKLAVAQASAQRKAAMLKTAEIDYTDDVWIKDPELLVSPIKRDLWSITKSGKFVVRLFNEEDFPLDI